MPVPQHETALSRGRIPPHLRRHFNDLLGLLLESCSCKGRTNSRILILSPQILIHHMPFNQRRSSNVLLSSLFQSLLQHYFSFDMFNRHTVLFHAPPVTDPVAELPSSEFYELSGFRPGRFQEISDNLLLLPQHIFCPISRCTASKQLALFLMLRRWKKADKWDDVSRALQRGRAWCIKSYRQFFSLLGRLYRKLVQVLDYRRIIPLLEDWSFTMVQYTGCCRDVLFFTDGKPWRLAKPGTGDAAPALVHAAGGG